MILFASALGKPLVSDGYLTVPYYLPLLLLTNSRGQGFSGETQQSNPLLFESAIRKAYDLLSLLNDRLAPQQ